MIWGTLVWFALRKPPAAGIRIGRFHVGVAAMIRATTASALLLAAAVAAALTLVRCLGQTATPPAPAPPLPAKATKELPPALLSLIKQKKMPKFSPVLVRIFKEEAELEVWKQDTTGRFQLLKTYPICRWSGDIGPKGREGDRQTSEGFYTITPELMNSNSNYYLAINTGFPERLRQGERSRWQLPHDPW